MQCWAFSLTSPRILILNQGNGVGTRAHQAYIFTGSPSNLEHPPNPPNFSVLVLLSCFQASFGPQGAIARFPGASSACTHPAAIPLCGVVAPMDTFREQHEYHRHSESMDLFATLAIGGYCCLPREMLLPLSFFRSFPFPHPFLLLPLQKFPVLVGAYVFGRISPGRVASASASASASGYVCFTPFPPAWMSSEPTTVGMGSGMRK